MLPVQPGDFIDELHVQAAADEVGELIVFVFLHVIFQGKANTFILGDLPEYGTPEIRIAEEAVNIGTQDVPALIQIAVGDVTRLAGALT